MKKNIEDYLWERIRSNSRPPKGFEIDFPNTKSIIDSMLELKMISSPKQAWATLEKWPKQGKYNYGCRLDLGWKEESN
jgi:hypothetical protein